MANAKIYVYDGAIELGSTDADGSGDWTYAPGAPLAAGPHLISAIAEGAAENRSVRSDSFSLIMGLGKNMFQDTSEKRSGENSIRIEKTGFSEYKIAVNDAAPVTVKAWMTKNSSYAGAAPTITLTGPGIDGSGDATASLSATLPDWQQLTVSGTPNAKGVVTLKVETFSTAAGANAWIDDITVAQ